MKKVYKNINELVGSTPLVELRGLKKKYNLYGNLYGKVEYFNPAGSIKDRVAKSIIMDAIQSGRLKENGTVIEPTSGNTGIGLALICASLGYKLIVIMPDTMSIERRNLIKAYGAEIILTPGSLGMKGAIAKANELNKEIPNSIIAGQFVNPANPKAHYETTGKEIYDDMNGDVSFLVSGVGTGGTITGAGRYLKEKIKDFKAIAVEPKTSSVLTNGVSGPHKIQGIGAGFVPEVLNTNIIDEIICVSNEDAFKFAKELAKTDAILVGISSGAAICAGIEIASRKENENKNIVIILPDSADRYYSTSLFLD